MFIEDRVAAGVVGGEDVLVATAVDLMMAKDCQGDAAVRPVLRGGIQQTTAFKAFFSAFVGTFSSHFSRLACGAPTLLPPSFASLLLIADFAY